ncbi:MAG: ATP-binding protein [Thermodesulfobacteriota bacterium]
MRKQPSIRAYLLGMNLLLLMVLFPAFGLLVTRETMQFRDAQLGRNIAMIRQSLASRGASLVRHTAVSAGEAVAGLDLTFLQGLIAEVASDDPDIAYCLVMDQERRVAAHSDSGQVGLRMDDPASKRAAALMGARFPAMRPGTAMQVEYFWPEDVPASGGAVMEAVFPVYSGDSLWGMVRCGYSLASLEKEVGQAREEWATQMRHLRFYLAGVMVLFFGAGLFAAVLLTRELVRGTGALHDGVRRVEGGDLSHVIGIEGMVCEEFAGLADSFNAMTGRLRQTMAELDGYSRSLEEKVAERTRELEAAQEILLKQAHEAGMAEMAVGVLHNIGNAITPAKVSASLLLGHLRHSPLRDRLAPSLAPLAEHLEGGRALSDEERRRLAMIIRHLPGSIAEEFERAVRELDNIASKHGHIENIIGLQMRYARLMDNPELVDINRLVRDAVKMVAEAVAKRGIVLNLKLGETPPVRVEEARLLQVLVNLLKNGYEAMDGMAGERPRELSVETALEPGENPMVRIAVRDTGCGFTEEQQARFFSFGYSTKERGSGFGLHSCANYLIANHGSIAAKSDGPGQGAEFVVRLPAGFTDGGQFEGGEG